MRVLLIFISALLAVCVAASATEDQSSVASVVCPHNDGLIDGPYVAEEATARAIATAVIEQMQSPERRAHYDLNVEDNGMSWTIFQSVRDSVPGMRGGGGLTMRIAKCDGALSTVHWQR